MHPLRHRNVGRGATVRSIRKARGGVELPATLRDHGVSIADIVLEPAA
jgi:hypothetical protein